MMNAREFLAIATREQKELLSTLSDLADEETEIASKINRVVGSQESGIHNDGFGITVCESADDVAIIAAEPIRELSQVRYNIALLLKRARDELNMSDVGIIERQWNNYKGYLNAR